MTEKEPCPYCVGQGLDERAKCEECGGTGWLPREEEGDDDG